ncbi:MAG: zinc-binding dehydrogenase, partial [Armatimonadota bacterium]
DPPARERPDMKAAVLHGPLDLRIEEVPTPEPGLDGVVVRIHSCAVCGTDAQMYVGAHQTVTYPIILGHEASAEVVEVGRNVTGHSPGERVTFWVKFGSFAEYNSFEPRNVAVGRLADNVTWDQGASAQLLCACLRGVDCSGLRDGQTALCLGQGPVGLLTLQAARARGAGVAVGVDLYENRLAASARVGARLTVSAHDPHWPERVREAVGEVDVAFDCMNDDLSPKRDALERLLMVMRPGGVIVVLSLADQCRGPSPQRQIARNVTIKPSFVPLERTRELMELACDLVAAGRVDVDSLITHRMSLDDVERGLQLSRQRPDEVLKVMVQVKPSGN